MRPPSVVASFHIPMPSRGDHIALNFPRSCKPSISPSRRFATAFGSGAGARYEEAEKKAFEEAARLTKPGVALMAGLPRS